MKEHKLSIALDAEAMSYQPDCAIIIYTNQADQSIGSIHKIKTKQGQPYYGPGKPLTEAQIRSFIPQKKVSLEYIPENMIAMNDSRKLWFVPAAKASIFIKTPNVKGLTVPLPSLLFSFSKKREMKVFALKCESRPKLDEKLWLLPLGNIYDNGSICLGSTPVDWSDSIEKLTKSFLSSTFSGTHYHSAYEEKGIYSIISELKKSNAATFPVEKLVEAGLTLQQLLAGSEK